MERRIRKPAARAKPFTSRCSDGADCDLWFALHHVSLSARSRACTDGSAFRSNGWHLSTLVPELQLLRRSLGWIYCLVWHCSTDGGSNGHLSGRSCCAQTPRGWRTNAVNIAGG